MNKLRPVVSILLLALLSPLALGGCEQPNDVPHRKEEALAAMTRYQERVDELDRRSRVVSQRFVGLPRDVADVVTVRRVFQQARTNLERSRNELRQVASKLDTREKPGNPEDMEKVVASLHHRLDSAVLEATSQISAVESWVAIAEQRRATPAPAGAGTAPASAPAPGEGDAAPASDAPSH